MQELPAGAGSNTLILFMSDHRLTSQLGQIGKTDAQVVNFGGVFLVCFSVIFFVAIVVFWVAESSSSHEYQGHPASIIHNPAVLRCPYLHSYCRTGEWLPLFNIAAAAGPARAALGQGRKKEKKKGGEKCTPSQWVAGWWIHKQDLVISYLLSELLSSALWCLFTLHANLIIMWLWAGCSSWGCLPDWVIHMA